MLKRMKPQEDRVHLKIRFAGDVAELGIIRSGTSMKVQVVLNPRVNLVPFHIEGDWPSYFIVAGLLFTSLLEPLIEGESEDDLRLLTKASYSMAKFKGEQIVVLSQVLANEVNIGYEDMGEYEYVDVIVGGERLIVDIDFRSEFQIARATKKYKLILQNVLIIFVGKSDRLQRIISMVREAAKHSLKKKGMPLPPWREAEYVKAKWLSSYTRTPSGETTQESSNPIETSQGDTVRH